MVHFPALLLALAASSVSAAPLTKRIAQVIVDSTAKWEQACLAAGGGEQCNPVSVTAFSTLLAAPGPCEQQNAADQMINLAKTLNNDATMIKLTQIFAQQPRNTPTSQSVPYCQQAPQNAELNGLFQCQFQGADLTTFVGGIAVGGAGTIPFGLSAPVSPAGSCPANPSGPIAAGSQLVDLTQDPGVAATSSNNAGTAKAATTASASKTKAKATATAATTVAAADSSDCTAAASSPAKTVTVTSPGETITVTVSAAAAASTLSSKTSTTSKSTSSSFKLQNGKDAQALNAKFATLTADSSCTAGENACVNSGFAQCVSGKFVITPCGATLTCAALPLVNSAGTSITCTTSADALSRIEATGATGGIAGRGLEGTGDL